MTVKTVTKRTTLQLDPEIFKELKEWKDTIHNHASKRRMPLSWNTFFLIVMSDWANGRTKCHCGSFYDCPQCNNVRQYFHLKQKREYEE